MKFLSVSGCRGLHGHGQPWVSLSGDVLKGCHRFSFSWLLGQILLPFPYSKGFVSHLVGGFFLTLYPLGNLFFATLSCSAAQLILHSDGLLCEPALQKWCNNFLMILLVFRIICLGIFWVEKNQCVCSMVDVPRIWEIHFVFSIQLFFCHSVMLSVSKSFHIYGYTEYV